jgi:methylmalonyl-CoA mutase cobalamin-binding subunit
MKILLTLLVLMAPNLPQKEWKNISGVTVTRIYDPDTNVVCYVSVTSNSYPVSTSISCFSMKLNVSL